MINFRLLVIVVGAIALAGCGQMRASQSVARAQERKPEPPPKEQTANATGITVQWNEKNQESIRRVLDLNAEKGQLNTASDSGELSTANGVLYRDNKPRSKFTAPRVRAYKEKGIVIADGGVTMTSIDPPGVTLKADRIRWDSNHNKVYAEGGARFSYKPPGASRQFGFGSAEHISFNTELQNLSIP